MKTDIMVFVPGTLGSELWLGNEKVWPGSLLEAVTGFSEARFSKLLRPDLVPRDIVRAAGGDLIGIYRSWIDAFQGIVRDGAVLFREAPEAGKPKTLYPFAYDWRANMEDTASKLATFLDTAAASAPNVELHLVGHSMGGLLARYYLESGKFENHAAMSKVATLITFGTPHNGAPIALAGIGGLHKTSFMSLDQSRRLANDDRYPSLYQLIPAPTHQCVWDADRAKAHASYPADAAEIVAAAGLSTNGLAAWKSFRAGLSGSKPARVRYFYLVGSRQTTMTRLEYDNGVLQPLEIEDGGDGTVPLLASVDPSVQTAFVGKSHTTLIDTKPARVTLAGIFGADILLSAAALGPQITLTVRDPSVSVVDSIHLLIEFDPPVSELRGTLSWQRASAPAPGQPEGEAPFHDLADGNKVRIELSAPSVDYINCTTKPIDVPGIYRPVLRLDAQPTVPIVGPAFAVQQIADP